ncbi:MAG: hypothetical protein HYU28_09685 [Actinobacteria bacterium]|nr:hypothetical protein [Actinomycetota bacterium]
MHKAIVGATLGGLVTVVGVVLGYHVIVQGNSYAGAERLIYSSLLQIVVMLVVMGMITRPRPATPLTWSRAMLGAVVVSGLSLLALGTVPNEFLNFAGSELHWDRRDLVMFNLPDAIVPFDISRQAIRDILVAGLYTNSFAAFLAMWLLWQRRYEMAEQRAAANEAPAEAAAVPAGTSAYGRPLSKQAGA